MSVSVSVRERKGGGREDEKMNAHSGLGLDHSSENHGHHYLEILQFPIQRPSHMTSKKNALKRVLSCHLLHTVTKTPEDPNQTEFEFNLEGSQGTCVRAIAVKTNLVGFYHHSHSSSMAFPQNLDNEYGWSHKRDVYKGCGN